MLIACWSVKGGSGTTVVSVALGLLLSRDAAGGALIVDLAGDVPAALGMAEPPGAGVTDWLAAADDVEVDALARLEVDAAPGVRVLPRGSAHEPPTARVEALAAALQADERPVVADCGVGPGFVAQTLAAAATRSLLVVRPCYLALRRAVAAPVRPSGVVLVEERGRALTRADVEDVLGVPVCAAVEVDSTVARAVDAGLLAGRLPAELERGLKNAA